jgi:Anthrone oxygenase
MSDSVRVSVIVMLGAGGIFTGGIVWYAWERVWIWRRLTLLEYAIDFRRSLRKADPAMPILLVVCASATAVFAWRAGGEARTLAAVGIALLVTIFVSSILIAEPINSAFRRRPEGDVPPDAERLRRRWRRFHLVRAALAVAAFSLLVVAVTYA